MDIQAELQTKGFHTFKIKDADLKQLHSFVREEKWSPDPDRRYKSIPHWANRYLVVDGEIPSSFDCCTDLYAPATYRHWGVELFKNYFPEISSGQSWTSFGFALWNGAEDTGWHTDNDGEDGLAESYSMILYHVPSSLKEGDGGSISFKRKDNPSEETVLYPYDGMGVLFEIDTEKFLHRAQKLINLEKDRFSFSVALRKS